MSNKFLFILIASGLLAAGCIKEPIGKNESGTFVDSRDNREYKWFRIGEQVWMAENLAWLPSMNGQAVGSDTNPAYYVYGYMGTSVVEAKLTSNFINYGVLYNREASLTACPGGWSLPGDSDWKELELFLGMSALSVDSLDVRFSGSVGKKLKSVSGGNNGGDDDNTNGFNALPAGGGNTSCVFGGLGEYAVFRTSTESGASYSIVRALGFIDDGVIRGETEHAGGYSVRCLFNKTTGM